VPEINRMKSALEVDIWTSLDTAIQKTLRFHRESK
jgi:hypothetical protein